MAAKALPPQSLLLQLFRYEPDTGKLFWRVRRSRREAFTGKNFQGYLVGRIYRERFAAHRVIWKMVHGVDPSEIDHINHDRSDNRLSNLREVKRFENCRNRSQSKANSSGVAGVMFHKAAGKWLAKIMVDYRTVHLGLFQQFDDAVAARKAAEVEYGFHASHGRPD